MVTVLRRPEAEVEDSLSLRAGEAKGVRALIKSVELL